jgi:hydrogenase maturation protease
VVGLGNPLSGDDGFGARVLAHLNENRAGLPPGASLLDAHTDLLNHLETLACYDRVVLVDAILDANGKLGIPGTVSVLDEEALLALSESSPSVHQVSPLLAVRLFRTLHPEALPRIILVGLLVDRISRSLVYATEERIALGADAVLKAIRQN